MAVRRDMVLDTRGHHRPRPVTVSATLAAVVGAGTLFGLLFLAVPLFGPTGSARFTTVVRVLAAVQLSAGVLLLTGARRFSAGAGRGPLFAGGALELLVCAAYGWYAVTAVAGNPQDSEVFPVFVATPSAAALMTASSLLLALRPSATANVLTEPGR